MGVRASKPIYQEFNAIVKANGYDEMNEVISANNVTVFKSIMDTLTYYNPIVGPEIFLHVIVSFLDRTGSEMKKHDGLDLFVLFCTYSFCPHAVIQGLLFFISRLEESIGNPNVINIMFVILLNSNKESLMESNMICTGKYSQSVDMIDVYTSICNNEVPKRLRYLRQMVFTDKTMVKDILSHNPRFFMFVAYEKSDLLFLLDLPLSIATLVAILKSNSELYKGKKQKVLVCRKLTSVYIRKNILRFLYIDYLVPDMELNRDVKKLIYDLFIHFDVTVLTNS